MHNIAEKVLPELYSMFLTTRPGLLRKRISELFSRTPRQPRHPCLHLNSVLVKQELRPPQPRKKWKRGLETLQMRTLAYQ